MENKQLALSFGKGITNVPSDAICDDNTLEESLNMVYENGEHRPIQKPVETNECPIENGETLLYVHTYGGIKRIIVKSGNYVNWKYKKPDTTVVSGNIAQHNGGKVLIESVGNTVVLSTSSGMNYLLWDSANTRYKNLGNKIPDIRVQFSLWDFDYISYPEKCINIEGMTEGSDFGFYGYGSRIAQGKYEDLKNALIGLVASRLNNVKEKSRFAFPFWARYAIRMYDGHHINISNPFLLMPTTRNNWYIFVCEEEDGYVEYNNRTGGWPWVNYRPYSAKLYYQVVVPSGVNLNDWSDIINGVDIFVSDEVKGLDMEGEWEIINTTDPNDPIHTSGGEALLIDRCIPVYDQVKSTPTYEINNSATYRTYYRPYLLSDKEITDRLLNNSVFYKVLELDMEDLADANLIDSSQKIDGMVLKNLTTQTQLEYDDYFSRTTSLPQMIKMYNHRLHMANILRDFFSGFTDFSFTKYATVNTASTIKFFVYIKSDSGDRIVKAERNMVPQIADLWFYYPDPRAYKVDIYDGNQMVCSLSLKEHPYLNGAYYFKRLPNVGETERQVTPSPQVPTPYTEPELLADQLAVSEAENPYIFTSKGYTSIGMGAIIGIASQTMALGENEHGIHPLTVFSEKGISLLRLNDEGIYLRSDEISREVANPDNPCIIETDGPVFFSSKKGLMMVAGQEVRCVSEQLRGKLPVSMVQTMGLDGSNESFASFIRQAFIAYDYRDSLLWIFDGATHGSGQSAVTGSRYCYVYSLKEGVFGRYDFGAGVIVSNVVNSYPDYLLQSGQNIYSLLERPDINEDGEMVTQVNPETHESEDVWVPNTYGGTLVTRPMKFDNALALKSIMRIQTVKEMAGQVRYEVYASNDLKSWKRLLSLRGTPHKYYRMVFRFTDMLATDRFGGIVAVTQERRVNKLR